MGCRPSKNEQPSDQKGNPLPSSKEGAQNSPGVGSSSRAIDTTGGVRTRQRGSADNGTGASTPTLTGPQGNKIETAITSESTPNASSKSRATWSTPSYMRNIEIPRTVTPKLTTGALYEGEDDTPYVRGVMLMRQQTIGYVDPALDKIRNSGLPIASCRRTVRMLEAIFHRIMKYPEESNWRRLRVGCTAFKENFIAVPGAIEMLLAGGFRPGSPPVDMKNMDGGESLVYIDEDPTCTALRSVFERVEEALFSSPFHSDFVNEPSLIDSPDVDSLYYKVSATNNGDKSLGGAEAASTTRSMNGTPATPKSDAKPETLRALDDALNRMKIIGAVEIQPTIETLETIVKNILKHPQEKKYTRLRLHNEKISKLVVAVDGAVAFLEAAGFEQMSLKDRKGKVDEYLVYGSDDTQRSALNAALDKLMVGREQSGDDNKEALELKSPDNSNGGGLLLTAGNGGGTVAFMKQKRGSSKVEIVAAMETSIQQIREQNPPVVAIRAINTMIVMVTNIMTNPDRVEYRRVRFHNPKFWQRVGSVSGCLGFLRQVGFIEDGRLLIYESDSKDSEDILKSSFDLLRNSVQLLSEFENSDGDRGDSSLEGASENQRPVTIYKRDNTKMLPSLSQFDLPDDIFAKPPMNKSSNPKGSNDGKSLNGNKVSLYKKALLWVVFPAGYIAEASFRLQEDVSVIATCVCGLLEDSSRPFFLSKINSEGKVLDSSWKISSTDGPNRTVGSSDLAPWTILLLRWSDGFDKNSESPALSKEYISKAQELAVGLL